MAQTFDTSRVGGGTYELEQDANGNYKLKSVGFAQVNKLNLPDLATSDTTTTTPKKEEEKKIEVADPFLKLGTQNTGGGEGGGQDYSGVMLKTPEVKDAEVRSAGQPMAKERLTESFAGEEKPTQTYADQLKQSQANVELGLEPQTQYRSDSAKFKERFDPTKIKAAPEKATGLQKVTSKATGLKANIANMASKSFALNAIKGGAKVLGAVLDGVGEAIFGPESNSQVHAKTYFNTTGTAQRIAGNPANDLYAGANRNAKELDGYGQKRIDTITKTISKMTPERKAKSSLPARLEKFEKQQQEYREDRAAAKDKASGNTKTQVTGFGKSGFGRDTSGGGGDTGGGSGRVICTDLHRTGELSTRDWVRDTKFTFKTLSKTHVKGYLLWAEPTVKHMQKYPRYRKIWKHIAQHRANDIAWRLNEGKFDLLGRIYAGIGEPVCWMLGNFVSDKQISKYNLTHWRRA